MSENYVVEMRDIVKSFYGVTVLHHVDLKLRPGEVHAIVGENGAGKSTLIKILTGIYPKDQGTILINGQEVEIHNARDGRFMSISCIHQELCLVNQLTIAQNVYLGLEDTRCNVFLNEKSIIEKTQHLLDEMGLHLKATQRCGTLTVAQQQMVEICRALVLNANVIIMDEPSASLTDKEVDALFTQIEKLKQQGKAIVYISHRLEEVMQIADTVSVLRDGHMIQTCSTDNITQTEMVQMMVGREVSNLFGEPISKEHSDEVVLEVKGLKNKWLKDVSFQLKKGEILGFAGLVGAGRTELARAIFGVDHLESGEIYIKGEKVSIHSPRDAIAHKVALVPEDRKGQGLVLSRDVAYNLTIAVMDQFIHGIRHDKKREKEIISEYAKKLSIKMTGVDQICKTLSGGNQQKVVVSKWLATGADIIIFDEPTRGIDVGAKAEIYSLMHDLAASGISIIMISSEMPEVTNVSDRICVMCEGRLSGIVEPKDLNYDLKALANKVGELQMGGITV